MNNIPNVKVIAYTNDPEKTIATAAKMCYSYADIDELMENLTEEKISSLIEKLEGMGHESPFEHVSFTFAIEGISRSCSHQLVRHRIASYSQKSQRYVRENHFKNIMPYELLISSDAVQMYKDCMEYIQNAYNSIRDEMIKNGLKEKEANEIARCVLPNSCETKLICTMNVRSLYNFFSLRTCGRAQSEIRSLATIMLKEVYKIAPRLFKHAGPKCLRGKCPEGALSCGHSEEIKSNINMVKNFAKEENRDENISSH